MDLWGFYMLTPRVLKLGRFFKYFLERFLVIILYLSVFTGQSALFLGDFRWLFYLKYFFVGMNFRTQF